MDMLAWQRPRSRSPVLRWLVAAILSIAPCAARSETLAITVEGLKPDLEAAARANLTLEHYAGRDVSAAQIRRLFKSGEKEIAAALEPYGFYNSHVASALQTTDKGFSALFRVTTGEATRVSERKVLVAGEAATVPAVQRAVRRFRPAKGEPLDHSVYEESKSAVEAALLNAGYLRMQETKHRVEVVRKTNAATIDVEWQSGPRLRFGAVRFSASQFPRGFLERYVPWKTGDYYSPEQLVALQQRLVDADYFGTVSVQPDLSNKDSLDVPINVAVTPAKPSIYTAAVYVTTDTGPGVHVGMQKRWINDAGHKVGVDVDWAQRRQTATASYRIPLPGPNDRSFNFGVSYKNEDTDTSHSRNTRVTMNEARQWHGFTRTLGLQYLAGTFEIADEQNYSAVFYGEATLSRKSANDFFFPRRGYSLVFGARAAPEDFLTDTSFAQVTADAKYIRSLGRRQRLILRGSLGAMAVEDFDELPPDLRFFAGGDRSIRGFDYQQIGSTNSEGKVIGGTYLAVASVEIERYFLEKWGAAVFVDGGDAFRNENFRLNVGAGVGVRWRSPVGVVRVDIATPVKSDVPDNAIRFHVAIGPDL